MKILLLFVSLIILSDDVESPHVIKSIPPKEIVDIAQNIYDNHVSKITSYRGMLVKRERVDGRDTGYQYIQFKFREQPRSIYLKFLKPAGLKNREVLYCGKDDVIVKRGGTFNPALTLTLDLHSPLLTDSSRYTLNDIGVKVLSKRIIEKLKVEAFLPGAEIKMYNAAKVDKKPAILYKLIMSPDTKEEADFTAEIAVDRELNIPIYYRAIDSNKRIVEEYLFRNIELNVNLTDKDFEENNDEYGFRKYE